MPRLYLFAEGWTEQTFASTVLSPHLANHGVVPENDDTLIGGRQFLS